MVQAERAAGLYQNELPSYSPEDLRLQHGEYTLYKAGLPGYPRVFFRDIAIAARLAQDSVMLRDTLMFAADHQGFRKNPENHEQPGSIFHEIDLETMDGYRLSDRPHLTTKYNACDTVAEFAIGHEDYYQYTGDLSLARRHIDNLQASGEYMIRHISPEGFFEESPKYSSAEELALPVPYWRDSRVPHRKDGIPAYPVIFTLAQIQNMAGLRALGATFDHLNKSDVGARYKNAAEWLKRSLPALFDQDFGTLYLGYDTEGPIQGYSTDALHAFHYLQPSDLPVEMVRRILETIKVLETPFGYRSLDSKTAELVDDKYHADPIWVHVQALAHDGAEKHGTWARLNGYEDIARGFDQVKEVSSRTYDTVLRHLPLSPELIDLFGNPAGCRWQLWADKAKQYFQQKMAIPAAA